MINETFNEQDVRAFYKMLGHEIETEIRLIDPISKITESLFVSSENEFVNACKKYNGKKLIYAGINERASGGTKGKDVISVKGLFLDIDAVRPNTKQPATNEELIKAREIKNEIVKNVIKSGLKSPVEIESGNGYQLFFRIPEVKITDENRGTFEDKLQTFQDLMIKRYDVDGAIDKIGDLPRIIKVTGTFNVKGDNTNERPHRLAKFLTNPENNEVDADLLEILNDLGKKEQTEVRDIKIIPREEFKIENLPKCINHLYHYNFKDSMCWMRTVETLSSFFRGIGLPEEKTLNIMLDWAKNQEYHEEGEEKDIERIVARMYKNKIFVGNCETLRLKSGGFPEMGLKELFSDVDVGNCCGHYKNPVVYYNAKCEGKTQEVGELYNKTSDYEIDVENIDFGTSKHSLNFDFYTKLFEDTEHLPQYELFDSDLGLDGDNYKPMKKCLNYYQHSLMQDTTKYKINHRTQIDNRAHILIVSGAGSGKTTIKNQNKRVLSDFSGEDGMIEVSGVSHPEQLVGKNIQKGKGANKTTVAVPGILAFRGVMNDESQDMLNEINELYAKSQRLKRLAMDSYGLNKISKKLVTDSPDDLLEYYSPSRICDFAHPQKLTSKFFDTGSFRRYPAFNINVESKISLKTITDFSFDKLMDNKITWKEALNNIYNNQTNVEFNEETLKIIAHYHKCLLYFLLKHKNQNAFRYAVQTRYSLRDMFCKYVLILAKAKHEATPTLYTTLSACSDVILFVLKTVETYNDLGNMGATADVWGGVKDEDAQALEYLYRRGAISKESTKISIKHFQTILANFYGCKVTQSRAHHYRLKRDGFIDSSQIGKNDSAVWLKFIPKEIELDAEGYDPLSFWDGYFKGASAKNDLLTALNSYFIDDKTFEKAKGDGGVGIVGCALIKKYICVEVYDNKNKNKIYTTQGATMSPQTPLNSFSNTATIKEEKKGIKTPILEPTPLNENEELI